MANVEEVDKATLWEGNGSPFRLTYGKQMMWFFLVSDALTFGGLLIAYMFARHAVTTWPIPEKVFHALPGLGEGFPLIYVALMTFILIVSSVTMVLAVEAGHRKNKKAVRNWLLATVVGGFVFVGSQAWEWGHFIHGTRNGVSLTEQGWANPHILEYEADASGHLTEVISNIELRFVDGGSYALYGAEALAAYNTAIPNEKGEYVILNDAGHRYGYGTPESIVRGADGKVTSCIMQVRGEQYRTVGGEKGTEGYEKAVALYAGRTDHIQGANLIQNEYAPNAPAFGDLFFFITGFHGFHVFSGVIINLLILIQVSRGAYDKRGHFEMVEKVGLYWHFVDLVWVFVFTFFYLL